MNVSKIPPVYGSRVRRIRKREGLSVRELSEKSGMSHSTVQRAEQGQDAALSTWLALASALGVPAVVLLADPSCGVCDGMPPVGFICSECGAPETVKTTETETTERTRLDILRAPEGAGFP